jgi:hypothetical protein
MGREEPLRISCEHCPGGSECRRDCLVEFFLGERDARVVRLDGDAARARPSGDLEPDLRRALDTLAAHGLDPTVVAHRRTGGTAQAS